MLQYVLYMYVMCVCPGQVWFGYLQFGYIHGPSPVVVPAPINLPASQPGRYYLTVNSVPSLALNYSMLLHRPQSQTPERDREESAPATQQDLRRIPDSTIQCAVWRPDGAAVFIHTACDGWLTDGWATEAAAPLAGDGLRSRAGVPRAKKALLGEPAFLFELALLGEVEARAASD